VAEDNEDMTDSSVMIDPDCQVFQNTDGVYHQGDRVCEAGFMEALRRAGWNQLKFMERGGQYDWKAQQEVNK
jgi:hypothetical protein